MKSAANDICKLAKITCTDSSEFKIKQSAKSKRRDLNRMDAFSNMEHDLKQIFEINKLRHANERKILELEEKLLAQKEKQYERGTNEKCTTTELFRMFVQNLAEK